jgi:hypothetical protein
VSEGGSTGRVKSRASSAADERSAGTGHDKPLAAKRAR